jgi:hypothetical protein
MTTSGPALTLDLSGAINFLQLSTNVVNTIHQSTSIDFELSFTWAPCTYPTGLLGERPIGATKSRQSVLQQRQLNLGFTFRRASVLREDVQDYGRTIDGRATKYLFEVALLSGRKIVLEDDGVRVNDEAYFP